MMFMMPMPPTSRLTAATAPSNIVIICVVPESIEAISFMSITLKLSSWFAERCRRLRISRPMSLFTRSVEAPSFAETWIMLTSSLPAIRR